MSKTIILLIACCPLAWGLAGGEDTLNELLKPKEMLPVHGGAIIFDESSSVFAFERIAKAWREGDAEALAPYLGAGKVTIQLPRVVGGVLSRSQAEYVLKDLFKYTVTETFEFTKYDELVSEGVVGIAERTYRSGKEGQAVKDKVSVWLVREGGERPRWVIKEIRAK